MQNQNPDISPTCQDGDHANYKAKQDKKTFNVGYPKHKGCNGSFSKEKDSSGKWKKIICLCRCHNENLKKL